MGLARRRPSPFPSRPSRRGRRPTASSAGRRSRRARPRPCRPTNRPRVPRARRSALWALEAAEKRIRPRPFAGAAVAGPERRAVAGADAGAQARALAGADGRPVARADGRARAIAFVDADGLPDGGADGRLRRGRSGRLGPRDVLRGRLGGVERRRGLRQLARLVLRRLRPLLESRQGVERGRHGDRRDDRDRRRLVGLRREQRATGVSLVLFFKKSNAAFGQATTGGRARFPTTRTRGGRSSCGRRPSRRRWGTAAASCGPRAASSPSPSTTPCSARTWAS